MSLPDSPVESDLIPITVLTGFLGSGKTTLLNALLKHPKMEETAVLINEFGDVGIDHVLVESVKDDVVLLNSGCMCCTVRSDLLTVLRDLYFKRVRGMIPEFTRLMIETTGLADPAPILHSLMTDPLVSSRYRLDGIVTTIDAVNANDELDKQPESVKQAAVADRLVITKADLIDDNARAPLVDRLRAINPAAPLLWVSKGQVDPSDLMNAGLFNVDDKIPDVARWLRDEAYNDDHDDDDDGHDHDHDHHHHHDDHDGHDHDDHEHSEKGEDDHGHHHHHHHHDHDVNRHDDKISSFSLAFERPLDWNSFVDAIEILIANRGSDLLRMKGILNLTDEDLPVVVHGVQHVFHPPARLDHWPEGDRRSRLVFITRDIPRQTVSEMLAEIFEQEPV